MNQLLSYSYKTPSEIYKLRRWRILLVGVLSITFFMAVLFIAHSKIAYADAIACPIAGAKISIGSSGAYGASRSGRSHAGIDLGAGRGTVVYAARSGKITRASWFGGYGNTIDLASSDYTYRYGHLESYEVGAGTLVNAGDIVGYVGNTGGDYPYHLHWEARTDGGATGYFSATVNPTSLYDNCVQPGSASFTPPSPSIPQAGGGGGGGNPHQCVHPQISRSNSVSSTCVKHLQWYLVEKYGYSLSGRDKGIDGSFGNNTDLVVRDFQKKFCLESDGIVGNQTWERLHDNVSNCTSGSQEVTNPPPASSPPPTNVSLSRPQISPSCSSNTSIVNISWSREGTEGVNNYIVDIDDDNFVGGFWNKSVGLSTGTTGPSGFGFYPSPGQALSLQAGKTYYVRVYFSGPNIHTPTSSFVAKGCASGSGIGSGIIKSNIALKGMESGLCLDINNPGGNTSRNPGNGANVHIWSCSRGKNQQWSLYSNGSIRAYEDDGSGPMCLDVVSSRPSVNPGRNANVQVWRCSGGDNQKWLVRSNGEIQIYNGYMCLDVDKGNESTAWGLGNGSNVKIYECHGGRNQLWSS